MIHIQYIIITVTWSEVSDQVVDKHGSPDQMRLGALLENNEISFWDFLLKKFFFFNELLVIDFLCQLQIKSWASSQLENHSETIWSERCIYILENLQV